MILFNSGICESGDWLVQGMMFMMMGSAEAPPEAPQQKTMFVEDMTEAQLATAVSSNHVKGNLIGRQMEEGMEKNFAIRIAEFAVQVLQYMNR